MELRDRIYQQSSDTRPKIFPMQSVFWNWIAITGMAVALVNPCHAVTLKDSLVLVDTTRDTTLVGALSVATARN